MYLALDGNFPFFEFSLCLSRACLGKMFIFIYKWRKKTHSTNHFTILRRQKLPTKEICTVCPSMALIQGQCFTQTSSGRPVLTQHTRTGTDKTRRMLVDVGSRTRSSTSRPPTTKPWVRTNLAVPCRAAPRCAVPCHAVRCPVLSRPVLSRPVLSCLVLSRTARSCLNVV